MTALLQRALRAGFMRAEALFNRAFGDRLNPLYHLGAISFFLFWVVGGTGLVLYAFFDTSVGGAYRSVEAISHGAWGAGGVLRTVHRHASDAMLLSMLIHLLRYFAFDRLRGFRWPTSPAPTATCCPGTDWRSSSPRPASSGWTGCPASAAG
jgi:hypothetical protein